MTEITMNSVATKKRYLNCFAEKAEQWKREGHRDDRLIYCNIYRKLSESLEIMATIENDTIWCGYNAEFKRGTEIMDRIKLVFSAK